jgi:hypothetical protein
MVIDIKNAKGFKRKMFFLFASPTDIHYEKIRMQKEEENIAA